MGGIWLAGVRQGYLGEKVKKLIVLPKWAKIIIALGLLLLVGGIIITPHTTPEGLSSEKMRILRDKKIEAEITAATQGNKTHAIPLSQFFDGEWDAVCFANVEKPSFWLEQKFGNHFSDFQGISPERDVFTDGDDYGIILISESTKTLKYFVYSLPIAPDAKNTNNCFTFGTAHLVPKTFQDKIFHHIEGEPAFASGGNP